MSFLVAAVWSIAAHAVREFLIQLIASVRSPGHLDIVTLVLCEGVAYLGTLFFMLQTHERERPLREALGLRRAPVVLCLLAVALGVALQGPLTLIGNAIATRFPPPEEEIESLRALLRAPTVGQKIMLEASVGLFAPVVEELFFRGGLLRGLRRRNPSAITLLGVSLLFAAAHLPGLQNFLPSFLGGLAMGYVRLLSGSIWPAILLHATFNSSTVFVAVRNGPHADIFTVPQSVVALVATLVLVGLYGTVAVRHKRCAVQRDLDAY